METKKKTHFAENEGFTQTGLHWAKVLCRIKPVFANKFCISENWHDVDCKMCFRENEYRKLLEQLKNKNCG